MYGWYWRDAEMFRLDSVEWLISDLISDLPIEAFSIMCTSEEGRFWYDQMLFSYLTTDHNTQYMQY